MAEKFQKINVNYSMVFFGLIQKKIHSIVYSIQKKHSIVYIKNFLRKIL